MDAKTEILVRIAKANVPRLAAPRFPVETQGSDIDRFCELVADYKAEVFQYSKIELAEKLRQIIGDRSVLVDSGLPEEFVPVGAARDTNFLPPELEAFEIVLTTCSIGIAETGTVILDHGPGQGRRAISLVPDTHICIIFECQIVSGVAEAVIKLSNSKTQTWISGPSATSDIELIRVEGVHGPRNLVVIVVKD